MRIRRRGFDKRSRGVHTRATPGTLLAMGIVFLGLGFSLSGCGGDGDTDSTAPEIHHPQDFLPPETEDLSKEGDPRIATDTTGLQEIVNGGYEVYTDNGFQEMVEQIYEATVGGATVTVRTWIFDMTDAENAAALHEELTTQPGAWEEWDEIGDEAHRKTDLLSHTILFRRDQYSVRLDVSSSSQEAKDLAILLATHIDQEIVGQEP